MASNWKAAHLRLLETLPRRTHYAPDSANDPNWRHWRKRGGRKMQPVVIDGVGYVSLSAAADALGSNRPAILQMIKRGEASFE